MKINYPIKYAAMPIIEQVGWTHGLHELEREYDIVCYIVSKCYLISNLTKYIENGQIVKQYEIVFPYQPSEFSKWQRVTPSYNLINGYCINGNKVDKIFDTYEDALSFATKKNEKLCKNSYMYLPYSEDYASKIQTKKDEFNEKLSKYKLLEEQILFNTQDMEIGKNKELANVIEIANNKGRVLSFNIYEILNAFDRNKFVVYNISKEQYKTLTTLINEEKNK